MNYEYEKVDTASGGLRLHLNENTAGCSPAVLAALHGLSREDAAFYPDYDAAVTSAAKALNVPIDQVLLTNGLDEGILAASVAALRNARNAQPEAIVVTPAFDMYAVCIDAMGGRVVEVPLERDFSFPAAGVRRAINSNTRLIFLTNPNNPTGQLIPRQEILELVRTTPDALVFLDEAYADFSSASLIADAEARQLPNLIIGRTFAKSYGLAGLRAGAVVGQPATLATLRQIVPPFSLNVCAAVALAAAFADSAYHAWYVDQVRQSKALLYQALDRLKIRYWPSAANFVLLDLDGNARRVIEALAARRIFIRDRSAAAPGCVRVTTGVVEHTRVFIGALEEVLCDAA
jgi:histidinol-phosphate aminotransferase